MENNNAEIVDERDTQGLIPVVVVKPFDSIRTPCPPAGTKGEIYKFEGNYAFVRFPLPVTDTAGATWHSHGSDYDYMRLGFELDEIEVVDE
ncbi:hypothetical protein [Vibrio parahaemolyticus]|uniref:hypothetical protein n=1 Tax=Vibrio parahaemolyticus TaxID=670 RepID=UPI003D81C377